MPLTTKEARAERRTNLADWVTAVMTIFWSVWWGFFMNQVLAADHAVVAPIPYVQPAFEINIPKVHYLAFSAVIVSFFAVVYVHWLWDAQKTAYDRFLVRSLVRSSGPLVIALLALLSSASLAGFAYGVDSPLIYYGVLLTLIWPIAVLVTLWKG